jgi:hypothetical protein
VDAEYDAAVPFATAEESGCPDCLAPVYDAATMPMSELLFALATMLFVPVAGPSSRYKYTNVLACDDRLPICVIATPLYVTPEIWSPFAARMHVTDTNRIRFAPVQVCATVFDVTAVELPFDVASSAIAIRVYPLRPRRCGSSR